MQAAEAVDRKNQGDAAGICYAYVMHFGLGGVREVLRYLDFVGVFEDWSG
jgi:hypothetical protein